MMKRIAILAVLACFGADLAAAKPLSRIIREIGLTPEDFRFLDAATSKLVDDNVPSPGEQASWHNPETNSKGTVRVRGVQGNCAVLQNIIHPKGEETSRDIRTRLCRDAGGNWLLSP